MIMQLKKSHVYISLCILIILIAVPATQILAQEPNLVKNGGFEDGFVVGLGVANEWGYFHSGDVNAGFYDDTWDDVVVEGDHAQLLELIDAGVNDTYAGIYQNISVEPGQTYELSFKGLIRSDAGSITASNYGYRMQYAVDLTGNEDWQSVGTWIELPWDEQPRTGPANGSAYTINELQTTFTAGDDSVTVFIRGWKKWADYGEGNYDIDAVRLVAVEVDSEQVAPTPTKAPVKAEVSEEPLPETGVNSNRSSTNLVILVASIVLIGILLGGALINQKRHRA